MAKILAVASLIDMDPQGNATAGVGVTDYELTIQKGGVGKTTASINLAGVFAENSGKTLV